MIKNVLPSLLAAAVQGFDLRVIKQSLMNFIPGPEHTPGRMNIFKYRHCDVMVDYAHNADGFRELHQFMQQIDSPDKIGIIGCPGDRRDEDLIEMGFLAGKSFDRLIIRFDKDGRGRSNSSIQELLKEGIENANPQAEIRVIADEVNAIDQAMKMADHGGFIVVCSEDYQRCIDHLQAKGHQIRKHKHSDYQMTG